MKKTLLYSLFCCIILNTTAQVGVLSSPRWQIKPVISKGFVMIHRISIGHLVKGYPTTYELNISKPSLGDKMWQLENNKPDFGITLQCLDFANPPQLGYALTVAPYIEIPLNVVEKPSRAILRLCWGATYITKKFDIQENHKNIAIGSHVNAFVQFRLLYHFKINEQWRFEPGLTFTHMSNGKARNPNLGLNVVSLSAGFNYLIPTSKTKNVTRIDSSTRVKSKNEITLIAATGFNERSIGSPELLSYVLAGSYQRNIRNTHKFSFGTDIYYDQNYLLDYEEHKGHAPEGLQQFRISARIGYSYNVGRLSFPIEIGYYIYQKDNPDANIVSRLGLRYYMKNGLIANFGLRTHYAVAYTFEYGLGYRFSL